MNFLNEDLARAQIQARLDAGREKRKLTLRALLARRLTSDRDVPANVRY